MTDQLAENILNMTNKDAADILKMYLSSLKIPRGSAKTTSILINFVALNKAIYALEHMPDEEKEKEN